MPALCNGQSFADAARVAGLRLGSAGRVGRRRLCRRQSLFSRRVALPWAPRVRLCSPGSLSSLRRVRPLAPSVSRWNYYSESDKPAFILVKVRSLPCPFPPSEGIAQPFQRQGGEKAAAGTRETLWSPQPRGAQPGGPGPSRPLPIKGRWAGIRGRGSFFSPPSFPPALGIREGRWGGGGDSAFEPGSPVRRCK